MRIASWLAVPFVAAMLASGNAQAASQDECAIWICAPGGFPSGCAAAHAAMVSRIKDLKPPLPSFGECAVSDPGMSQMGARHGRAAYVPEHTVCDSWRWTGGRDDRQECVSYRRVPERYVHNTTCTTHHETGERTPAECTRTVRFIEVYVDGALAGPTYYW